MTDKPRAKVGPLAPPQPSKMADFSGDIPWSAAGPRLRLLRDLAFMALFGLILALYVITA